MDDSVKTGIIVSIIVVCVCWLAFCSTPVGVRFFNSWGYALQKEDDATNYKTAKKVEDTCRSMIISYEADKLMYEQYCTSDKAEELSWANNAKIRANKTALMYNEFILKNSFVWEDNIPLDIKKELPILQ